MLAVHLQRTDVNLGEHRLTRRLRPPLVLGGPYAQQHPGKCKARLTRRVVSLVISRHCGSFFRRVRVSASPLRTNGPRDCPGRPQAPLYVGPSGGAFVPSRSRHSGASTQGAASARPFFSRGCFSFNARVLGHQKLAPQWRQLKLLWRLESAVMEPPVGLIVDSTPWMMIRRTIPTMSDRSTTRAIRGRALPDQTEPRETWRWSEASSPPAARPEPRRKFKLAHYRPLAPLISSV